MTQAQSPGPLSDNGKRSQRQPGLQMRVPDQVAGGVYANTMVVHHTPTEFVMDFAMVVAGVGQVVARVITSPAHMKQVLEALVDNVRKYEAVFGPIEPPGTPQRE